MQKISKHTKRSNRSKSPTKLGVYYMKKLYRKVHKDLAKCFSEIKCIEKMWATMTTQEKSDVILRIWAGTYSARHSDFYSLLFIILMIVDTRVIEFLDFVRNKRRFQTPEFNLMRTVCFWIKSNMFPKYQSLFERIKETLFKKFEASEPVSTCVANFARQNECNCEHCTVDEDEDEDDDDIISNFMKQVYNLYVVQKNPRYFERYVNFTDGQLYCVEEELERILVS